MASESNSPDEVGPEEAPETSIETGDAPSEVSSGGRWRIVSMIVHDGIEPPPSIDDRTSLGSWAAVTSPWHPAILAQCAELPRIESVETPSSPEPDEVRVLASRAAERLPSGYRTNAADSGAALLEGETERLPLIRRILNCLADHEIPDNLEDAVSRGFLALGAARWWLRDLTIAMGHIDCLDVESLTRETLAGARAWKSGDANGATNRLRAAFELLTQARERFYPVDAYFVDLCLLDPGLAPDSLNDSLDARAPVSFVASARAIETLDGASDDPLSQIRTGISEGWADVVGGAFGEPDEPIRPFESILWQYRKGSGVYRRLLDDRAVETFARRRFGLYAQLPQIARRFGFRFGVYLALDQGRFPIPPETKRLWEAPDGSYLEALTRPPIAADRADELLRLPWRLARTMKEDHVATVAMVHWPDRLADWFRDLRTVASFSPVLARWVTLSDYFHLTDRPFEMWQPELDAYVFPYLDQATARLDTAPISRRATHARLRARLDAVASLQAILRTIRPEGPEEARTIEGSESSGSDSSLEAVEESLESGRFEEAGSSLDTLSGGWADMAGRAIVGEASEGRAGYLVLNPVGVARRAVVLLPDASADLRPEGPLRAAQLTEEGVWAVVELPPFGYCWVPKETALELAPAPYDRLGASGRTLRNEHIELTIDPETGGIRSLRATGESEPRLGQQLVISGLVGPDGAPEWSRMRGESFEVDYGGPALVQAHSGGVLVHPDGDRMLARFQQRLRLWSGRPQLELEITLADIDPDLLQRIAEGRPWSRFFACRWAWADPDARLRRSSLLGMLETNAERPETPDVFEIAPRDQRSALLFGGLAHHQRHGTRMLDTLLIAGRESERQFRLGVVLDLEHPIQAAQDMIAPAFVVPTHAGPPANGPTGWFFQLDSKAVAVTRVEPMEASGDGRSWGVAFHLVETAGRPARCRLRLARAPKLARQTDFNGDTILELPIDDDGVHIDLTPCEIARIEVSLGE